LLPRILEQIPAGVQFKPIFDQSLFVEAAIGNVVREGLIAATLTATMVLLFLGSWRGTCIIAVTIPLSILSSLIVLHLMGQTLNLMTLGGLALAVGILVDDATVEIENIERQRTLGKPLRQAIFDGAREIALPALVSTLCICIVFLPLFFLTGIAHSLFVPLAEAVIFAILASYILSRTLIPTLVMYAMTQARPTKHKTLPSRIFRGFDQLFESFRERYTQVLAAALHRSLAVAVGFTGFCVLSAGLYPLLGRDFFPNVDAGQLRLHVRAPAGTRLEEMPALIERVDRTIRETIPEQDLGNLLDIIGGPYTPRNTVFGNSGAVDATDSEVMISLQEGHHGSSPEYADTLRRVLADHFPGVEFFFQPPDQVSQVLNFGTPAPIDIQITGSRTGENLRLAIELNNELRRIPGMVDVHVFQRSNRPALDLRMDRTKLQQIGLTAQDVAQNLLIYLSGSAQTAPSYWLNPTNGNTYNIGVQTHENTIDSLDALLRTPIAHANGTEPQLLGNLVSISRDMQPSVVSHYDAFATINIHANVSGRDLGSVGQDIDRLVEKFRPRLAHGSDIEVRGLYRTMQSSYQSLAAGLIAAIALVYFLIVINFQSYLDPLIIIAAVPAALAGIAWVLFLSHTPLSVPALTGTIMTVGVATANSILVVSFARERMAAGLSATAAALAAGSTRLRPVLMTALAMIAGMLPMAIGTGAGAEQNAPLGRAVIGGLLLATVATLFFVPVVFAALHNFTARKTARHKFPPHGIGSSVS
jgi:multidrug efflux pump subunit AcrB